MREHDWQISQYQEICQSCARPLSVYVLVFVFQKNAGIKPKEKQLPW